MNIITKISVLILLITLIHSCKKEEVPTLTTSAVTNITGTTASSGGNITSEGSGTIISRGVCWSTGSSPTIADNKTSDGTGAGSFTSSMIALNGATTYYVRAYASSSAGTGYGMAMSFTTLGSSPTANIALATNINVTSATLNGSVNANHLSTVVTFEYGTSTSYGNTATATQSPVTNNTNTNVSATITGLTGGTIYHYRVKAVNALGTTMSNDFTFTTFLLLTDIEGNTYRAVSIGTQVWMAENLKTTKYNDGTAIPNVTGTAWGALTTPGYCWYNNDAATYKATYGALYNWYTVNTGKLCPTGWHVPTDAEWTTLENYLTANGYNYDGTTTGNKYAKSLASTTLWTSSATVGAVGNTDYPEKRNATGFTALPGGFRSYDGAYGAIGFYGYWWSSSTEFNPYALNRRVYYNFDNVFRSNYDKQGGFSVRCIRD
jgi:uncharacterized protein (TIGR02145 family)